MLNHTYPAPARTSERGRTLVLRLPSSKPPPCTRMAAGNGPGPSGTCRSRSTGLPPGRVNSTSLRSTGAADRVAREKTRMKSDLRMNREIVTGKWHGQAGRPVLLGQQGEYAFAGAGDDVRGD